MVWSVELSRAARKDLAAIRDKRLHGSILSALVALQPDPFAGDVRKLAGYRDVWRLRVGEWRVCYRVDKGVLMVLVVGVAPRGEAYEIFERRLG